MSAHAPPAPSQDDTSTGTLAFLTARSCDLDHPSPAQLSTIFTLQSQVSTMDDTHAEMDILQAKISQERTEFLNRFDVQASNVDLWSSSLVEYIYKTNLQYRENMGRDLRAASQKARDLDIIVTLDKQLAAADQATSDMRQRLSVAQQVFDRQSQQLPVAKRDNIQSKLNSICQGLAACADGEWYLHSRVDYMRPRFEILTLPANDFERLIATLPPHITRTSLRGRLSGVIDSLQDVIEECAGIDQLTRICNARAITMWPLHLERVTIGDRDELVSNYLTLFIHLQAQLYRQRSACDVIQTELDHAHDLPVVMQTPRSIFPLTDLTEALFVAESLQKELEGVHQRQSELEKSLKETSEEVLELVLPSLSVDGSTNI
ncbi:uncharacterized protein TRAVEDRAFT_51980 [Trametes versicolor FP-101664 SS1]|uniref:uncharacterized protein n=1 Tax=Trametes versicolor (strain FP-101664) TaxID=717944 RepID=UPI00046218BE|nr:uncharacterized protein TRAVEDRAFT_51980 [Trametes versicolor FP-101664 SS1]EIW54267.1 hypothetical protein TRAVEDRAFT_51980 [Trametes versicolor FP-101664 SS1]